MQPMWSLFVFRSQEKQMNLNKIGMLYNINYIIILSIKNESTNIILDKKKKNSDSDRKYSTCRHFLVKMYKLSQNYTFKINSLSKIMYN